MKYFILALILSACCEGPPETYKGVSLDSTFGSEDYECAVYSGYSCEYILCQDYANCSMGWELTTWYCW